MSKLARSRIPLKEHAKLKTEDAVDRILDKLIFAKQVDKKGARKDCLFMPHDMGPMWMRGVSSDEALFAHPEDVNSPDLVWPLSVGAVWPGVDEEGFNTLFCNYWESVPAQRLRGKYRFVGRRNIANFHGQFIEGWQFLSAVEYATWAWGAVEIMPEDKV